MDNLTMRVNAWLMRRFPRASAFPSEFPGCAAFLLCALFLASLARNFNFGYMGLNQQERSRDIAVHYREEIIRLHDGVVKNNEAYRACSEKLRVRFSLYHEALQADPNFFDEEGRDSEFLLLYEEVRDAAFDKQECLIAVKENSVLRK